MKRSGFSQEMKKTLVALQFNTFCMFMMTMKSSHIL